MTIAIEQRLDRERRAARDVRGRLAAIRAEARELAVLDCRSADEIIGYDEQGVPT